MRIAKLIRWIPFLVLTAACGVQAASIAFGRDVRYPTRWEARSVATAGGGQIVLYPSEFATRRTGTGLKVDRVGVVRQVGSRAGKPLYELHLPGEETPFVAEQGRRVKVGEREFLPMGWHGRDYRVLDLKTRKVLVFHKPAAVKTPASPPPPPDRAAAKAPARPGAAR